MSEDSGNEQKEAQPSQDQKQEEEKSSVTVSQQGKKETPSVVGTSSPSSTPIGIPVSVSPKPTYTPTPKPVGGPIGVQRPATGGSVARPASTSQATLPVPPRVPPSKAREPKVEISRRNFIKGLAILGGLAVVASYIPLFPYLQGSVGAGTSTPELQLVQNPNLSKNQLVPIRPADVDPANGTIFQYPYVVGDSNVNSDSFVQCVLIQLPKGFNGEGYSVHDPSTGNDYVAFSRVCVHLWCLWSYNINDPRGPVGACPCHGSTYVPGSGNYPKTPSFSDQPPGMAVAGPASLQTPPNNMLPIIQLKLASDGTFHATGRVGQVGCGQKC